MKMKMSGLRRAARWLGLVGMVVAVQGESVRAEISVTDNFGRRVVLAEPAKRILSLAPHTTENLFSAGAGARIIGVAAHSDYPPRAREIPSVGNSYAAINLEAVLALAPDLVVAWETAGNRESLQKIERLGFSVYRSEPRDFARVLGNIEDFAVLAGLDEPPGLADLRAELRGLRGEFSGKEIQSVFYPISTSPLMSIGGAHVISRALEICGARNAFGDLPFIAPQLSIESLIKVDPDIIVIPQIAAQPARVAYWKKWPLRAAERDAFVAVDADAMNRPTARMILHLRDLCVQIDEVRERPAVARPVKIYRMDGTDADEY